MLCFSEDRWMLSPLDDDKNIRNTRVLVTRDRLED